VKDDCGLLIKTIVFVQHLVVKEILVHGLYSMWKTFSLLYSPSIVNPCVVMQHMTAVGHRQVCPTLTNTCLVNPPIDHSVGYPVGPITRRCFSCQRNQPFEEDFSYHLGWLSVTVCTLVPSKAPFSDPPMLCRTTF